MSSEKVYDLCVVGAGMFGSAAARHASANPALKVCLIGPTEPTPEERPKREVFGSHYDEGRVTRVPDQVSACQILSKHSIERYRELEKLSGIDFHSPVGCMFIDKENGSFMLSLKQMAAKDNVSVVQLANRETFSKRYPYFKLKENEIALLDDNGGGHISPRKLVAAQKKVASLQGCDIINSTVCDIKTLTNGLNEVVTETEGSIKAKRVLIATGAFVNLKTFQSLQNLSVKRCKETVVLLKIPDEEVKRLSSMPDIIILREKSANPLEELGAYILPPIKYPDGEYYLKFGEVNPGEEVKTLEEVKNWYLSNGDETILHTHLKLITDLIPGLKFVHVSRLTCVTCYTPTGLPYIDRVSPTVTVAVAGNAKGAKFSDEVGRIAAALSVTGSWDSELSQEIFRAIFE